MCTYYFFIKRNFKIFLQLTSFFHRRIIRLRTHNHRNFHTLSSFFISKVRFLINYLHKIFLSYVYPSNYTTCLNIYQVVSKEKIEYFLFFINKIKDFMNFSSYILIYIYYLHKKIQTFN